MTAHVREQIAAACVTALTGLATTGANVFRDRDTETDPLQPAEIPGLTVDDDGDPAEIITIDPAQVLERRMALTVTGHVKATTGFSATLNQILAEIETKFAITPITGAQLVALTKVAPREKSQATDQPTVRQAFNFEILYYTAAGAPTVAL